MKKLFAFVLALVLVLGFAGCGPKNGAEPAAPQQTTNETTMQPPTQTQPPANLGEAMSELNQLFNAEWPENEFTKLIPKPTFNISVSNSDGEAFTVTALGVTTDQLKDYVNELKSAGFNQNQVFSDTAVLGIYSYKADNGKGYTVEVSSMWGVNTIAVTKA